MAYWFSCVRFSSEGVPAKLAKPAQSSGPRDDPCWLVSGDWFFSGSEGGAFVLSLLSLPLLPCWERRNMDARLVFEVCVDVRERLIGEEHMKVRRRGEKS